MEHAGRTYVVTGADSGIGADLAAHLERQGARVIRCGVAAGGEARPGRVTDEARPARATAEMRVDVSADEVRAPTAEARADTSTTEMRTDRAVVEVHADLATADGRRSLVDQVRDLAPDGIDGLGLVAGTGAASPATVSLNYFGTVTVAEELRADLATRPDPRAVLVSSASSLSAGDNRLVEACLSGAEPAARRAAERLVDSGRGARIYRSTKIALNRWLRRAAPRDEWAGAGIPLNAVAPGIVDTESARTTMLADPAQVRVLQDALPQPLGLPGPVPAVTSALSWLLTPANSFTTGQVLHVDGGAEVTLRGEEPYTRSVSYGPWRMARMVYWSTLGRRRPRR